MTKTKREIYAEFLKTHVNPIFEKLIVDLLHKRPENVLEFINIWTSEKLNENKNLNTQNSHNQNGKRESFVNFYGEESNNEDEDEVDDIGELEFNKKVEQKQKEKSSRASVSAEAYGKFNKKSDYKPKVIPKNDEQIDRIKKKLEQAFMFSALDPKEKEIVINAFEEKTFQPGQEVIKQGEEGDNLYVVDLGELDCYKRFKGDENDKHLKVYKPGEAFGELALLYNAPRAATIIAKTECVLWALDRECFNNIVKDAAAKKRESYEKFLGKIELLNDMDPYERSKIADAFKSLDFTPGEHIVTEGENGDSFYFIERGQAYATKILIEGTQAQKVLDYEEGDYFGELALLRDSARAANVIAKTDVKVVSLDRNSFKRLIGPLEDILKRNFGKYEKFIY